MPTKQQMALAISGSKEEQVDKTTSNVLTQYGTLYLFSKIVYNKFMAKVAQELQFKVLIEQDEDGIYVASVPELPGCYTQGKTVEEVRKRIEEVIELVLDSDKKIREEKIKSPKSFPRFFGVEDVEIRYA